MIKYSPSWKIADISLLISFKSPNFRHSLSWNSAMTDVLHMGYVNPIQPPRINADISVHAVPYLEILNI